MKCLTDYYTFGSIMPGRNYTGATSYRYNFNGKPSDKEVVSTSGGTQDYGFRIYNPSLGKFLSVDPLTIEYPFFTPYQFAANKPITSVDLDGLEELDMVKRYDINGMLREESIEDVPTAKQDPKITSEYGKVRITEIRANKDDKPLITILYSNEIPENLKSEYDKAKDKTPKRNVLITLSHPSTKTFVYSANKPTNPSINKISIIDKTKKNVFEKNTGKTVHSITIFTSDEKLKEGVGMELQKEYQTLYPDAKITVKSDKKIAEKIKKDNPTVEDNFIKISVKFKGKKGEAN